MDTNIPFAFAKYQYMANLSAHRSSSPRCDIVRLVCSKCQTCQQSTSREWRSLHLEQTEPANTTWSPPRLWKKQSLSNIALLPGSESPRCNIHGRMTSWITRCLFVCWIHWWTWKVEVVFVWIGSFKLSLHGGTACHQTRLSDHVRWPTKSASNNEICKLLSGVATSCMRWL